MLARHPREDSVERESTRNIQISTTVLKETIMHRDSRAQLTTRSSLRNASFSHLTTSTVGSGFQTDKEWRHRQRDEEAARRTTDLQDFECPVIVESKFDLGRLQQTRATTETQENHHYTIPSALRPHFPIYPRSCHFISVSD